MWWSRPGEDPWLQTAFGRATHVASRVAAIRGFGRVLVRPWVSFAAMALALPCQDCGACNGSTCCARSSVSVVDIDWGELTAGEYTVSVVIGRSANTCTFQPGGCSSVPAGQAGSPGAETACHWHPDLDACRIGTLTIAPEQIRIDERLSESVFVSLMRPGNLRSSETVSFDYEEDTYGCNGACGEERCTRWVSAPVTVRAL